MRFSLLNLVAVLLSVLIVSAKIDIEDVPFELLDDDTISIEERFREAIKPIDEVVSGIKNAATITGALAHIPVIGEGFGAISKILVYVAAKEWRDGIYKAIPQAIDQSHAINDLIWLQSTLNTIYQQFNQLKADGIQEHEVQTKLEIIQNELMKMINLYAQENVVFRRYPQFSIPVFDSIAILLRMFEPLREKAIPNRKTAQMACRVQDLVEDYRELNVFHRLQGIRYKTVCGTPAGFHVCNSQPDDGFKRTVIKSHDQNGYNSKGYIGCYTSGCALPAHCLIDRGTKYEPDGRGPTSEEECTMDYIGLLRQRIEKKYDRSYNMLGNVCTSHVRYQQSKTGYGWLKLIFLTAHGESCDISSYCDLYIRLSIDDNAVYTTRVVDEEDNPFFYEMYESKKINKHSRFELNLRDKNVFQDKSLVRFIGSLSESRRLIGKRFGTNYFHISVLWRDEYQYEYQF